MTTSAKGAKGSLSSCGYKHKQQLYYDYRPAAKILQPYNASIQELKESKCKARLLSNRPLSKPMSNKDYQASTSTNQQQKRRGRDKFRPTAVYHRVLAETVWLAPDCAGERSDDTHFAGLRCSARFLTHRQSGGPHFHSRCSVHDPLHLLSPASVLSHSHPPSSTRK